MRIHKFRVTYNEDSRIPEIIECEKLWNDTAAYSFLVEGKGESKWDCVCSIPLANVHKIEQVN